MEVMVGAVRGIAFKLCGCGAVTKMSAEGGRRPDGLFCVLCGDMAFRAGEQVASPRVNF